MLVLGDTEAQKAAKQGQGLPRGHSQEQVEIGSEMRLELRLQHRAEKLNQKTGLESGYFAVQVQEAWPQTGLRKELKART